jgi:CheY-like chemotaxis protein
LANTGKAAKKLLLVDDEPDVIAVMKIGLERAGYKIDAFTEPKLALEKFKPGYYDGIVVDVRMPSMTGFEFARRIWAADGDVHVCFLSSFEVHEAEARKVLPKLKTSCFIKKPLTPSMLAHHIEVHLVNR